MNLKNPVLKKTGKLTFFLMFFLFMATGLLAADFSAIPEKGMVTMVDLGAKKCIPCKMMAPILEKLETAYKGNANIIFIDVWENPKQATRFKTRMIPTQIFFNEKGEEVFRHVGFFDEASIVAQMDKMGINPPNLPDPGNEE